MVEDNPDEAILIKRCLRRAPCSIGVTHVESGDACMELLRGQAEERPDLILLDLNMPGMDGRDTLAALAADSALASIPVIVFTTSNHRADVARCYELGCNAYVVKPVGLDKMQAAVDLVVSFWLGLNELPPRG